jgi:hypothetical protein
MQYFGFVICRPSAWLESKRRLPKYVAQKPTNLGLRSQYSIRLYSWAKKYAERGIKNISLEEL